MNTSTSNWDLPTLNSSDEEFFQVQELKQMRIAYRNFLKNTKSPGFDDDDEQIDGELNDDEDLQIFFHSKIKLFQLFIRTQSINIRQLKFVHLKTNRFIVENVFFFSNRFFSSFYQEQERIVIERLFYLVLNNIELTNFSRFHIQSIINISNELEKYQKTTKKLLSNTTKLNSIVQFVLSFSPSSVSSFRLNNLFYILLNDMTDFSGKMIDRIAEVLRVYHFMTYGHSISKQYLLGTVSSLHSTIEIIIFIFP